MNDIEKLNQVIDTLEEQSVRVTEFNGILDSVDSSRKQMESSGKQVESAQKILVNVADEQKLLIAESYKSFEDLSKKLDKQESSLSALGHTQKTLQKDIETLTNTIKSATDKQEYAIDSLQKVLIFGLIFVMVGVVFMNS